jgi:hypothetical protein
MIQIRKNVFETNSSSTHSLVMAVASDFDKWESGEMYYCEWAWGDLRETFESGKFYPAAEVDAYFAAKNEERDTECFVTYDEFCDSEYLEVEDYTYTTPGGEVIKAVAKYGYDG